MLLIVRILQVKVVLKLYLLLHFGIAIDISNSEIDHKGFTLGKLMPERRAHILFAFLSLYLLLF